MTFSQQQHCKVSEEIIHLGINGDATIIVIIMDNGIVIHMTAAISSDDNDM